MKNMKLNFGFSAIAVGAFALAFGLAACGDGGSTNGPSNDEESPSSSSEKDGSSSSVASSSSSVILSSSNEESSSSVSVVDPATVVMGTLIDARDDQVYKTVTIGSQTWMAENLNYDDGNSSCYELDNAWCEKNGRLYPWLEAMKACPSGWHLPSDDEWITLWTAVGGDSVAGAKLKSTDGWNEGGNGSDSFGFAVLPAGYFDYDLNFNDEGSYANYWSSSDPDNLYPVFWYFYNEGDGVYDYVNDKSYGLSVRCLKD